MYLSLIGNLIVPRILSFNVNDGILSCFLIAIIEPLIWFIILKYLSIKKLDVKIIILICILANVVSGFFGIIFSYGFLDFNRASITVNIIFSVVALFISSTIEFDISKNCLNHRFNVTNKQSILVIFYANLVSYSFIIPYIIFMSLYNPEPSQIVMINYSPDKQINNIFRAQYQFYQDNKKFISTNNLLIYLRKYLSEDTQYFLEKVKEYWHYEAIDHQNFVMIKMIPTEIGFNYGLPTYSFVMNKSGEIRVCKTKKSNEIKFIEKDKFNCYNYAKLIIND
ncbi:hypothetical protein [Geminocystis sp. NIES-3709]|uniref:hypothetical protein n=1 Tax=Geminocystis sp. NIES-3709 TaxID=1617448 RepID=UPI0005FC4368|nr:hypothetical protein [Geminocystis sp. NIES-3709]BAQ66022.1 hypothetical protein GM3709_2787 [Geminocystis sp. NIES-3709]